MDLVAELSSNAQAHKEVVSVIPLVAQVTQHKHYTQHLHLMETVCSQVNVVKYLLSSLFKMSAQYKCTRNKFLLLIAAKMWANEWSYD